MGPMRTLNRSRDAGLSACLGRVLYEGKGNKRRGGRIRRKRERMTDEIHRIIRRDQVKSILTGQILLQ